MVNAHRLVQLKLCFKTLEASGGANSPTLSCNSTLERDLSGISVACWTLSGVESGEQQKVLRECGKFKSELAAEKLKVSQMICETCWTSGSGTCVLGKFNSTEKLVPRGLKESTEKFNFVSFRDMSQQTEKMCGKFSWGIRKHFVLLRFALSVEFLDFKRCAAWNKMRFHACLALSYFLDCVLVERRLAFAILSI